MHSKDSAPDPATVALIVNAAWAAKQMTAGRVTQRKHGARFAFDWAEAIKHHETLLAFAAQYPDELPQTLADETTADLRWR